MEGVLCSYLCILFLFVLNDNCYSLKRQQILNKLLSYNETGNNETGYDSGIAPDFELDTPTAVKIQILIQNIYSVSESHMDYSIDVLLRQKWIDSRLKYDNMSKANWLELDNKIMDKVWVPDTYFANEKKANLHVVTVPNRMMHLYRNGTVLYSMRLSLTLSCDMRLEKYPLDNQKCPIIIESYAYTVENVVFKWWDDDSPVKILKDVAMPQFEPRVEKENDKDCGNQYAQPVASPFKCDRRNYSFACLQTFVLLERKVGYFVVQVFIPSALIVVLSWVSFWVDHDAVPARISLGVLCVLTMTTQSSGSRQNLPQVSYVKAIDVWMSTCLLFVFVALLEYSFVNVLARKHTKTITRGNTVEMKTEKGALLGETPLPTVQSQNRMLARKMDKVSRVAFPAAFFIFNLVFWIYYLLIPNPE